MMMVTPVIKCYSYEENCYKLDTYLDIQSSNEKHHINQNAYNLFLDVLTHLGSVVI